MSRQRSAGVFWRGIIASRGSVVVRGVRAGAELPGHSRLPLQGPEAKEEAAGLTGLLGPKLCRPESFSLQPRLGRQTG